jgi:hypothetical protein
MSSQRSGPLEPSEDLPVRTKVKSPRSLRREARCVVAVLILIPYVIAPLYRVVDPVSTLLVDRCIAIDVASFISLSGLYHQPHRIGASWRFPSVATIVSMLVVGQTL